MFEISKVTWTDGLSVGIGEIDSQHQELFLRLNDLVDAVNEGKGAEEVGR